MIKLIFPESEKKEEINYDGKCEIWQTGQKGTKSLPPIVGEGQDGGTKITANARQLRKNLTDAEQKLWRHIRGRQLKGYKFRRQAPIKKFVVDFVCFKKRLVIELDGGQHAAHQDYDHRRTEWLQSQGFKVIRFWDHDVLKNIESTKEVIMQNLTPHPDLPPQWGEGIKERTL